MHYIQYTLIVICFLKNCKVCIILALTFWTVHFLYPQQTMQSVLLIYIYNCGIKCKQPEDPFCITNSRTDWMSWMISWLIQSEEKFKPIEITTINFSTHDRIYEIYLANKRMIYLFLSHLLSLKSTLWRKALRHCFAILTSIMESKITVCMKIPFFMEQRILFQCRLVQVI